MDKTPGYKIKGLLVAQTTWLLIYENKASIVTFFIGEAIK
jgi:hypothetical protein